MHSLRSHKWLFYFLAHNTLINMTQNVSNRRSFQLLGVVLLLGVAAVSGNFSPVSNATAAPGTSTSEKVAPVPRPDVNPDLDIFQPPVKPLSPEQSQKHFYLPEGYGIESVLTEPHILEPVAIEFDANGRMYVAEMRTYMQNIDGNDQDKPVSRVSVHVDSNNDGTYDQHTVFADNLKLPRMLLALREGELLISETWDDKVYLYKDTDGDFQADEKEVYFKGTNNGGNLEHQSSGPIWSMDNWLYTTYDGFRVRWDGSRKGQRARSHGQWGLTQDRYGKPWFVNAGGEQGPVHFQQPIAYGSFSIGGETDKNWKTVYPLVAIPDVQGAEGRFREKDKTLNHFTATCGQEIVRGHRLPGQLKGDLLFAEPVGRLIRRGKVTVEDGVTYLDNPHEKAEFIRSTDPLFRPVNLKTAPDGTIYIVDMYRGIIQEGNWVGKGSYLRKVVKKYGLHKLIGRGRIWRLGHRDFQSNRSKTPDMYDQPSEQLVQFLSHPNGWWRNMAQRQIVLRQDASVTGELQNMVESHRNHLARIHALWTLEGLNQLSGKYIQGALQDSHPYVRKTAIRASESLFRNNEAGDKLKNRILKQFQKDAHPQVRIQVMLTAKLLGWDELDDLLPRISSDDGLSKGVLSIAEHLR